MVTNLDILKLELIFALRNAHNKSRDSGVAAVSCFILTQFYSHADKFNIIRLHSFCDDKFKIHIQN